MDDMRGSMRIEVIERGLAAGLAMLALVVQVLVPQGFMVARQGDRPAIVICTGHGPVLSRDDLGGHPGKAPKSRPDAVCGFAGHGAGVTAAGLFAFAAPAPWSAPDPVASNADLAPGRGLAAPPPPSQAPPPILS
jgi:hypothetical protein